MLHMPVHQMDFSQDLEDFFEQLMAEFVEYKKEEAAKRARNLNIIDEPIPQEEARFLRNPLYARKFQPEAPARPRRVKRREALLREFDRLWRAQELGVERNERSELERIRDLFEDNKEREGEEVESGRRFIRWRFIRDLGTDLTPRMMAKIRENVNTSFYAKHVIAYQLRNIEDGTVFVFFTRKGSPWFERRDEAEAWLKELEGRRLELSSVNRPNTKWAFEAFSNVDLKVVLARQPLLGAGPLPNWLRNLAGGRSGPIVALDSYQDILCLWCCIAVHQGARPDRSTQNARELAKSFFKLSYTPIDVEKTSLDALEKVEKPLNENAPLSDWTGIRVYEPEREVDGGIDMVFEENPARKVKKHFNNRYLREACAFVIKDITKLAKTFACVNCQARFTKACNFQRHTQSCSQGKTIIVCPGERVEAPKSSFEKAFYPFCEVSKASLKWLEQEAKRRKIHIHHAKCGHDGERWVEGSPVDGYQHETRTVFQYHVGSGTDAQDVSPTAKKSSGATKHTKICTKQ